MNISIDLGNVWDFLAAVGTIGATVTAVWLALRKPPKRIAINMIWDYVTKSVPQIYVYNTSSTSIAIKSIEMFYKSSKIYSLNMTNICGVEYTGFLAPNEHKIFTMENQNLDCDFPL